MRNETHSSQQQGRYFLEFPQQSPQLQLLKGQS